MSGQSPEVPNVPVEVEEPVQGPHLHGAAYGVEASSYILGALYLLLFLYVLITSVLILVRPGKINLRKRQRLLVGLLLVISLLRGLIWVTEVEWGVYDTERYKYLVRTALYSLPAFLLVSAYSILVSYWIDEYAKVHLSEDSTAKRRRAIIIFIANVLSYVGEIALLVAANFIAPETYKSAQPNYLNALYIFCVLAFLVYGILVYRQLKDAPIAARSTEKLRKMKRVLFITITVAGSFAIRVTFNFLWPSTIAYWEYRYVFQVFFYFVVEMVPVFLIVFFLVHVPKASGKKPLLINQLRYGELQDSV